MADKLPLKLEGGRIKQFASGDTISATIAPGSGGPGGGVVYTNFTRDLGVSCRSGTFDITGLSGLTSGKVVEVIQTAAQIASKGNARDEFEMDNIQLTGYVFDATTIRVYWNSPGVVVGTYAFGYLVSG